VYWGPENRAQTPLPPLSYNMGPQSNVNRLSFGYDSLRPTRVEGTIRDKRSGDVVQVQTTETSRPALANDSATVQQGENTRRIHMPDFGSLTPEQAVSRAQALTDNAGDAVTVEGELDVMRYGGLIRPHSLVTVRGAGFLFDGRYYVQRVTHHIQRGNYTQDFQLTREGLGSTVKKVR
jgi:phage protein D